MKKWINPVRNANNAVINGFLWVIIDDNRIHIKKHYNHNNFFVTQKCIKDACNRPQSFMIFWFVFMAKIQHQCGDNRDNHFFAKNSKSLTNSILMCDMFTANTSILPKIFVRFDTVHGFCRIKGYEYSSQSVRGVSNMVALTQ